MATNTSKNTAKLMLKRLRSRLDSLYNEQEQLKAESGLGDSGQQMKCGGKIRKFTLAGTVDGEVPYWERQGTEYQGGQYTGGYDFSNQASAAPSMEGAQGGQGSQEYGFDWGNAAWSALGAAPNIYNMAMGMGKPDLLNESEYFNPQYNKSIDLMSNRRFNVNPLLERISTAERIGARDLSQNVTSSGGYLAGRTGLSAARMRAEGDVYANKQNMDNQYLAEEAQMRSQLGSERAGTKLTVRDINDRNKAARRNYLAAGMSGLGTWANQQQLSGNRNNVDSLTMDIFRSTPWFAERFPTFNAYKPGQRLKKTKRGGVN